jgi:hypothetical protein
VNESSESILIAAERGSMEQSDLAEVRLGLAQEPGESKIVFSPFPNAFTCIGTGAAFGPEQVRSAEHDSQSARSVAPSHLRNPVCGLLVGQPWVGSLGTTGGEPVLLRGRQRVPESAYRQRVDYQDKCGCMTEENQVSGAFRRIEEFPRCVDQLHNPAVPTDPQAQHISPGGRSQSSWDPGPVGQK